MFAGPFFLTWYQKIYYFLLYIYPVTTNGCFHQSPVDTNDGFLGVFHLNLAGAIGVNTTVIEESASHQEPQALDELNHLRMIHHTHVEHAVIRHCIRGLAVAWARAYAHRHHLTIDDIAIDLKFHLILHAMEEHHE